MPKMIRITLGFCENGWRSVAIGLGNAVPFLLLAMVLGRKHDTALAALGIAMVAWAFVARSIGRTELRFLPEHMDLRPWGVWSSKLTLMYRDIEEVEIVRSRPTPALVVKARGETLFLGPFDRMSLFLGLEGQLQRAAALLLARRDMLKGE